MFKKENISSNASIQERVKKVNEKEKCNIEEGRMLMPKHTFGNSLYYIAVALMPSILLFFLYNRNYAENHMIFWHVIILAVIGAIAGLILFIIFKCAVASVEGALLLSLMFWLSFWLFEMLLGLTRIFTTLTGPRRLSALLLVFFVIILVIFRKMESSLKRIRPAFNSLAVCLIAMFLVNIIPGISNELNIAHTRGQMVYVEEHGAPPFYIKRNFFIELNLPSPDIYWFHVDGLMNIETVEGFWGLCYEHFRKEFETRGFIINKDATLNAGSTYPALAALLSPTFYDSFFGELLVRKETLLEVERRGEVRGELAQVGLTYAEDIMPYLEMFAGLVARGYTMYIPDWGGLPTSFEHLEGEHIHTGGWWYQMQRGYLPELLSMTTPLNLVENRNYMSNEIASYGYNLENTPHFVLRIIGDAHMYNIGTIAMEMDPALERRDYTRYDLYPIGFERAIERVLGQIDEILDRNPHAVIILQSDHGFHYESTQQYLLDVGYSLEQVLKLNSSVFSAVRIPDKYGGLEESIAPLNISRELVNRFVGKNYELLSND